MSVPTLFRNISRLTRSNGSASLIFRNISSSRGGNGGGPSWKAIGIGTLAVGAGVGGLMAYKEESDRGAIRQIGSDGKFHKYILTSDYKLDPSDIARKVRTAEDKTRVRLTLFQYTSCPFCCKVRTFLDYHGFNYDIVEVNSVRKNQIAWSRNYKKVPILVAQFPDGTKFQLNDSTFIMSALRSWLVDPSKTMKQVLECYPYASVQIDGKVKEEIMNRYFLMFNDVQDSSYKSKEDIVLERKWRHWVDDVFVHTLSPNIYRSFGEAVQSFKSFDMIGDWEHRFQWWERSLIIYLGAAVMYFVGGKLKKKHRLKDDVRQSLYDEMNFYLREIDKRNTTFMGGELPNLADLALFGALTSIEGCEAFQDLYSKTKMKNWYDAMRFAVGYRHGRTYLENRHHMKNTN